jgi:hypothetical protein
MTVSAEQRARIAPPQRDYESQLVEEGNGAGAPGMSIDTAISCQTPPRCSTRLPAAALRACAAGRAIALGSWRRIGDKARCAPPSSDLPAWPVSYLSPSAGRVWYQCMLFRI